MKMGYTQYEGRVPRTIRDHTESLMARWREEGRPDAPIEDIVKSIVLNAYVSGCNDGYQQCRDDERTVREAAGAVV